MTLERELRGKLGFGCMRLPMDGDRVNTGEFCQMIDAYLSAGFHYFDTAHGYLDGKSERALKECLVKRYPRERYFFVNKLSGSFLSKAEDVVPFLENQLELCGLDYFDLYLMHSQSADVFRKFRNLHCYEQILEQKALGRIRHFGISFHDTADILEDILKTYPEIEVVQLQFNYLDYEDPAIQSKKCYDVCQKYKKPVLVMEPVKGGHLAQFPNDPEGKLSDLCSGSPASYAIRFAASFPGILMVLSGMSTLEQMQDNLSFMQDFHPLSRQEMDGLRLAAELIHKEDLISCTACRYCVAGCPKKIAIPDLFSCMNARKKYQDWSSQFYYEIHTAKGGKASDCIRCGKCEKICPQHLPIRKLLEQVTETFEMT